MSFMLARKSANYKSSKKESMVILPRIKFSAKLETSPPKEALLRMTIEQLSNVEDFRIWNEHGEIVFLENVDLR